MTQTDLPTRRERTRQRHRRHLRTTLVALVAVLALVVGGVAAYAIYLDRVVASALTRADLLPAHGSTAPQPPAETGAAPADPASAQALDVLVIGVDDHGPAERGRSDVMVIAHVDADRRSVTLVHLPRDMQVAIPGHGEDKLNASYAYGGAPLLVQTVEALTGVRIDHVAQMDFAGFSAMTDAIGGVEVDNPEASPRYPAGAQRLDGASALTFVRERKALAAGDLSRGRRQQALLKGLLLRALSPSVLADPRAFSAFVGAAAGNATVDRDLTNERIRSLALELRDLRGGDVRFVTAPIAGFATRPDGASVDLVDTARMRTLGEALRTDRMSSYQG